MVSNLWRNPHVACTLLSHIKGMETSGYKSDGGADTYFCCSPYNDIGERFPELANNIAYYVYGNASRVTLLKLVLNVNEPTKANEAQAVLMNYSDELTRKALGVPLPDEIKGDILQGYVGQWNLEGASLELKRDEWPTGRGYELHFIIS